MAVVAAAAAVTLAVDVVSLGMFALEFRYSRIFVFFEKAFRTCEPTDRPSCRCEDASKKKSRANFKKSSLRIIRISCRFMEFVPRFEPLKITCNNK